MAAGLGNVDMRRVVEIAGFTRRGKRHSKNEDTFHLDKGHRLVMVADGMGGHRAGEVASTLAKEAVVQQFHRKLPDKQPPSKPRAKSIRTQLKKSVFFAHQLLKQAQIEHAEELGGMGCALTVVRWGWKYWHIAHVGDIGAYSYSHGTLHKLTQDHTMVASLVKAGYISAQDALKHPLRHRLTQAVGQEDIEPELASVPIWEGDKKARWLVVCSDGVWDTLGEEGIARILDKSRKPWSASRKLVNTAWKFDGRDDCTAVVTKVQCNIKQLK